MTLVTPAKPPHERGKSSYHDPKRAIARSTSTGYVGDDAFPNRSPALAASAFSIVSFGSPRRTPPSVSSLERSFCPASTFRRSSSWNDAIRSTHASTRYHQVPQRSTGNDPDQRSLPSGSS